MRLAAAVPALALAILGGGAACSLCTNTFISEHLSPDSVSELIIYEKNCGAMLGSSTHVDLVPTVPERGQAPEGVGNVLQADAEAASLNFQVRWIDAKTVELSYRKLRIGVMRPRVDEVSGVEVKHVHLP